MEIIMSIKPKWCEDIFNGKKWYEVRKTIPKNMKTNTKVYVCQPGSGGVVGEFTAIKVFKFPGPCVGRKYYQSIEWLFLAGTCLTSRQLLDYLGDAKHFYEIVIKDPVLYKTQIPLSEFGLKRPPVSWCYVKDKTILQETNHD